MTLDVLAAAERIRGHIHRTPIFTSKLLNELTGKQVYLKCENLQRSGSFKARGAFNMLIQLSPEQRKRGVVAFSSGNHAQAVALAAHELQIPASIVMPDDAPKSKVAATRAHGAEIYLYDRMTADREQIARDLAGSTGATVVPPFDHEHIVEGQGTATLELLENVPDLDAIVTPLGGGGLLSGSMLAADGTRPGIRVFGVEPEKANDWQVSVERGERVRIDSPQTIADGLRTPAPGAIPFEIVQKHENPVLVVSDQQIKTAMRFLLSRLKLLVEPSGAVGAAAVMQGRLPAEVQKVGVVLSGGNIDLTTLGAICAEAADV